ncbi:Single-stranded DNA-binding protein [Oligella sp. MSHR50489EDL]|uniref:single-stranded DNA-binding protein n=1 Tax=Oligella sp. MSHR50489EDL TaxID=3139409 RepID=UPI003D813C74
MSVNKVILVGRLGGDPEVRASQSGVSVANISLATNHVAYDRDGNKNESTEWHRVVFFGRQAEVCEQYLRKGSQIYVEGRLQTEKYKDRDGVERYVTKVIGDKLQMLGSRDDGQNSAQQQNPADGWGNVHKNNSNFASGGKAPGNDYARAKDGGAVSEISEVKDDLPF